LLGEGLVARALIRDARIILLDEPFEGLAPLIVRDPVRISREPAAQGRTIVVVEQNVVAALSFADRVYILNNGHVANEGTPDELHGSPEVMKSHLGD
jgi:branched-chain amino acid transport system ATP-binding protein